MKNSKLSKMMEELEYDVLKAILPQLLVAYDLDSIYIKNEILAIKKIYKILGKEKILEDTGEFIIIANFRKEKRKFLSFVDKVGRKSFDDFSKMFLFYGVSLFENMVNQHLQGEMLLNHRMSVKEVNDILVKLNTEDKLGWFLEILSGKNFTKSKSWEKIKPFIKARNFFIHYKPEFGRKYSFYADLLTVNSMKSFLDISSKCYCFLARMRSAKLRQYYDRIEKVEALYDERTKRRKKWLELTRKGKRKS